MLLVRSGLDTCLAHSTTGVKRDHVPKTFSTWSYSCRGCDDTCSDQQHAQSRDDQRTFPFRDARCHSCFSSLFILPYSSCHRFLFRPPSHLWLSAHALYFRRCNPLRSWGGCLPAGCLSFGEELSAWITCGSSRVRRVGHGL